MVWKQISSRKIETKKQEIILCEEKDCNKIATQDLIFPSFSRVFLKKTHGKHYCKKHFSEAIKEAFSTLDQNGINLDAVMQIHSKYMRLIKQRYPNTSPMDVLTDFGYNAFHLTLDQMYDKIKNAKEWRYEFVKKNHILNKRLYEFLLRSESRRNTNYTKLTLRIVVFKLYYHVEVLIIYPNGYWEFIKIEHSNFRYFLVQDLPQINCFPDLITRKVPLGIVPHSPQSCKYYVPYIPQASQTDDTTNTQPEEGDPQEPIVSECTSPKKQWAKKICELEKHEFARCNFFSGTEIYKESWRICPFLIKIRDQRIKIDPQISMMEEYYKLGIML